MKHSVPKLSDYDDKRLDQIALRDPDIARGRTHQQTGPRRALHDPETAGKIEAEKARRILAEFRRPRPCFICAAEDACCHREPLVEIAILEAAKAAIAGGK